MFLRTDGIMAQKLWNVKTKKEKIFILRKVGMIRRESEAALSAFTLA